MHKLNLFTLIIIFVCFCNCAGSCKNIKFKLPESPRMSPVNVIDGKIGGKDLDNAISNHIALWKYVESLKTLLK